MKKLVVLSGAGISAPSGIKTFRDQNGLWENHRIEEVACPEAFMRNPQKVLDFYNQRRRQLLEIQPNRAHYILAELEDHYEVKIITQNVDDLHERAGSTNVIHLHGELLKARPVGKSEPVVSWKKDLNVGDTDSEGRQLRPHIVWFGENVPAIRKCMDCVQQADICLVIGTSLQVYPAAGLIHYVSDQCQVYVVDPNLDVSFTARRNYFALDAVEGMERLKRILVRSTEPSRGYDFRRFFE